MPIEFASFAFIITLAAVVNGLGIVRWLTVFAEFMRHRQTMQVKIHWVYVLAAGFQFLLHILLWWSLWGVRGATTINFLTYLYLLAGPVLLFLGTTLLMPDTNDDVIDLRVVYFDARRTYSTVLVLLWLWAIFMSPVFRGVFAPTVPIFGLFLLIATMQRASANSRLHAAAAVSNWILIAIFVALYAMQLGGAVAQME